MENKIIIMDKEGFEKYLSSIEKLESELAEIRMYKGKTAIYQGDNWHDNPELYQIEAEERSLMQNIAKMRTNIENIEIVERNANSDIIDIGDIVKVNIAYSEDDIEELIFKLVGGEGDMKVELIEISINSPLGKAVYQKKVGENTSYSVDGNIFNILISEKLTNVLEENVLTEKVKK